MGEVYLAEDTTLNRRVALKLLPLEHTQNEERLRRFKQEAKGHHFTATEFIDGETLRASLRPTGRMKMSEALNVAAQVASALAAARRNAARSDGIDAGRLLAARDGWSRDHIGAGQHRPSGDAARGAWSVSVEWSASRVRKVRSADGRLEHEPQLFPAACVSEGSKRESTVVGWGVDASQESTRPPRCAIRLCFPHSKPMRWPR